MAFAGMRREFRAKAETLKRGDGKVDHTRVMRGTGWRDDGDGVSGLQAFWEGRWQGEIKIMIFRRTGERA